MKTIATEELVKKTVYTYNCSYCTKSSRNYTFISEHEITEHLCNKKSFFINSLPDTINIYNISTEDDFLFIKQYEQITNEAIFVGSGVYVCSRYTNVLKPLKDFIEHCHTVFDKYIKDLINASNYDKIS